MPITTGLRTLLLAQPNITAICKPQKLGNTTYPGIFNEFAPEGFKPPYVLISKTDTDPLVVLDGTYGLRFNEFDFECYSRDQVEAESLGDIVETFIKDYTGQAGPSDTIKAVILENRRYDKIFEEQGGDQRQHIQSISVTIQHQRTDGS